MFRTPGYLLPTVDGKSSCLLVTRGVQIQIEWNHTKPGELAQLMRQFKRMYTVVFSGLTETGCEQPRCLLPVLFVNAVYKGKYVLSRLKETYLSCKYQPQHFIESTVYFTIVKVQPTQCEVPLVLEMYSVSAIADSFGTRWFYFNLWLMPLVQSYLLSLELEVLEN